MKSGRNDPCPCGSGKKYKKCCYLTEQNTVVKNYPSLEDIPGDDDDDDYNEPESFFSAFNNLRRIFLDSKPHIKKYYKIRNMHSGIVNTMIQYHYDGKFKKQIDTSYVSESKKEVEVYLLEADFNLDSQLGAQAFYDMWIYKTAANVTCITDNFLRDHRYRKPEKIEFLHSMLDSRLGLFEITGTDMKEGYAYLKDVFTGAEYTIIDIGLSGNFDFDKCYIYTRIISYDGICFGTGLNFIFQKTDAFIKNHIQQHRKNFNPNGDFLRFTQLYNQYSKDSGRVKFILNEI